MPEISANYTSKHLAEVLEAVEQGERFTVVRRGRAVAELTLWECPPEPDLAELAAPQPRPGFFRRLWPLGRTRALAADA